MASHLSERLARATGRVRLGVAGPLALVCLALAGCSTTKELPGFIFYPELPMTPRYQFLTALNDANDVAPEPSWFSAFVLGDKEQKVLTVGRPYGMAYWADKLYVCDMGAGRGVVFDFKRQELRPFADRGPFRLAKPSNISVGPQGEKYVADTKRGAVIVLSNEDKPVRLIKTEDAMKPCDVVWHDGELFVGDLETNTVIVFDPKTGRVLRRIGKSGSKPGEFFWPTNLAFGPEGNLYVCDTLNARVQKLDRDGKVLQIFGSLGQTFGKMVRPKGIAVDREGRLYVADAAADSVHVFNKKGKLLLMLGQAGAAPGDMALPAKVIISYQGIEHFAKDISPDFEVEYLVFVSNQYSHDKINVYGFGKYTGVMPSTALESEPSRPSDKAQAPGKSAAAEKGKAEDKGGQTGKPNSPPPMPWK